MGLALLLAAVVTTTPGGAEIDWSAGVVRVSGGAGGDLRAASPAIARAAAGRKAQARIVEALGAIPVVGGNTVAGLYGKSADRKERVAKLVAESVEGAKGDVRYASDGGLVLKLTLGIDQLAAAVAKEESAGSASGSTGASASGRIVVIRRKVHPAIVPGGTVRYYDSVADAQKDARLGDAPETVKTRELSAKELARGPVAVVIQTPE